MRRQDLLQLALKSLRAHKLRSFLTLLGIIIGVMTIVVVVGGIGGLNRSVAKEMETFSPDVYVVTRFGIIMGRKEWINALKRPKITYSDYEKIKDSELPNTQEVAASADDSVDVRSGSKRIQNINLVGVTGNHNRVFSQAVESGAFFADTEDRAGAHVAVIGEDTRAALFPTVDPLGRTILCRGIPFRVIGVMPKKGGGLDIGNNPDGTIYVPMSVYRQGFMVPGESVALNIKARGGPANLEASQDEVRVLMRAMRHTGFRAPDPFGLVTQEALLNLWKTITGVAFSVMILISSISLTVGGVVIMNIMLVSVAERTQEIGQRRAIGARKRHIQLQFLLEAAMLSSAGGVVGIILGSAIVVAIRSATEFPAAVSVQLVLGSLLVSTLVGILAGYLPARRASNLLVIDALRAE